MNWYKAAQQNSTPGLLYHTTSFDGAESILMDRMIKPSNEFSSLSEKPYTGDIRGNDVILIFNGERLAEQLMPVDYSEEWFRQNPSHGSYVAGEGWMEQYEGPSYEDYPDFDPDDPDWEPWDDDFEEQHRQQAEMESFMWKSQESEWISRNPGQPVVFDPSWVLNIKVIDPSQGPRFAEVVKSLGYNVPVTILG